MARLWLLTALLLITNTLRAFPVNGEKSPPVPPGAKVSLEADASEYFLGDSVLLHFTLRNTGPEPFDYSYGWDYRGVNRSLRFKFRVFDEKGTELPDPFPNPMCMGGLGGTWPLEPGKVLTFSLPLFRYWHFDKPGTYTIRVHHDFGWNKGEGEYPYAEIKLTLKMPDDAEAERVVNRLDKLPKENPGSVGERDKDFADWSGLRYGVYLKPLLKRVRQNPQRYLEGIDIIPTIEATRALIELAGDSNPELRQQAAKLLRKRVGGQYPDVRDYPLWGGIYISTFTARVWSPDLRDPLRSAGKNLIRDADQETVAAGAWLLQYVAQPEDAPVILDALEKALNVTATPRTGEKANPLNFPSPLMELLDAANTAYQRGYQPDHLYADARFLLYFHRLSVTRPDPMPDGWLRTLDAFGTGSRYAVRERALASIPPSVPDDCVKYVQRAFNDPDAGVLLLACELAGNSKRREFLKPVLEVLQTTRQDWIIREAGNSACILGGQYEASLICANRLAEDGFFGLALEVLVRNLDGLGGSGGGRTDLTRGERIALREAWQQFLTVNAAALKSGKRIHYQDPTVTRELFGRARSWDMPDGSTWPTSIEEQNRPPAK